MTEPRTKGCGVGCLAGLLVAGITGVIVAVALLGIVAGQARARLRAGVGLGSSSADEARVGGLPDDVPVPEGDVVNLPAWTPQGARPVDNRGTRKGLVQYPRAGAPYPYIDLAIKWNLDQVLDEYPMRINYTFRPTWRQRELWFAHLRHPNPNGVALPGTSIHESGCAVDTDFRSIGYDAQRRKVAVFARYGFQWKGRFDPGGRGGLAGDPVHFEIRPERVGWRSAIEAIRYNQGVYRLLSGDTR